MFDEPFLLVSGLFSGEWSVPLAAGILKSFGHPPLPSPTTSFLLFIFLVLLLPFLKLPPHPLCFI